MLRLEKLTILKSVLSLNVGLFQIWLYVIEVIGKVLWPVVVLHCIGFFLSSFTSYLFYILLCYRHKRYRKNVVYSWYIGQMQKIEALKKVNR